MSPVPKDRSKENLRDWMYKNERERQEKRMTDLEYERSMMSKALAGKRDNVLR